MQLIPKQLQQANESVNIEINGSHVTVNTQTDIELLKKICLKQLKQIPCYEYQPQYSFHGIPTMHKTMFKACFLLHIIQIL